MGRHKGKRISLTIDEELFAEVQRARCHLRMRNVCEYVRAALVVTLNLMADVGTPMQGSTPESPDYINEMFNAFANWEPQPDGNAPKIRRKRDVEG